MKLFGKKEAKTCNCGGQCKAGNIKNTEPENGFLILGAGCSKCLELEHNVLTAVSQMGIGMPVGHITDFTEIASYGVMSTPALVLNGKVISYGKVLSVEEIRVILQRDI